MEDITSGTENLAKILVTGGAGFIGCALVRHLITQTEHTVVNVDNLTYASKLAALDSVASSETYTFEQADICDLELMTKILNRYQPDVIAHLAAESHVDRSIQQPKAFIETNIVGTYNVLEAARRYWSELSDGKESLFRFLHVSTDEVYGDLASGEAESTEESPYRPSSPYAASKAAADHLVRAWHRTFGLPVLITNCSNNYGPFQYPEKLIPLCIKNALAGKPIPLYGDGNQVRDWVHVEDHVRALMGIIERGRVGDTYNVGGSNPRKNIEVVTMLCRALDQLVDQHPVGIERFEQNITFVQDRPGHDTRYAVDTSKLQNELGWSPLIDFADGLKETAEWFLADQKNG